MVRLIFSLVFGLLVAFQAAQAEEDVYFESNPAVSPNGRYVAFYSDINGSNDIYIFDFESGARHQLTEMAEDAYGPKWASDSQSIIFYSGANGRMEAYQISLAEGALPLQLTALGGYVSNPVLSSDGREMAFSWNSGNASEDHEIYVMNVATGAVTQLTDNDDKDYTPVWSPDGTKIAFSSNRDDDQFDLYIMDASGRNQQIVADLNPHDYYPAWHPDGDWIAFFSGPDFDHFDAHMVHVETGEIKRLTENLGGAEPSFCPDGSCLVFAGNSEDGGSRIYISNPDGREVRLLKK